MPGKLYILGLGVEPCDHATVETLQAAGECDAVYAQGLSAEHRRYLERFCDKGRVVQESAKEPELLARMTRELSAGKTVALATLGHPFYWGSLASRLTATCEKKNIPWQTFGSISPMGVAICVAGVTLGTNIFGLQSFDYAAIAERQVLINPYWPLAIYFYSELSPKTFAAMTQALLKAYPKEHEVLWCSSAGQGRGAPLSELASRFKEASSAAVLYLAAKAESKSRVGRTDYHPMSRTPERVGAAPGK